jgi:hypothetical protein
MNETNSAVIARLDRATQYSRDGRVRSRSRGVLDRPVQPGDDSLVVAGGLLAMTDREFRFECQTADTRPHSRGGRRPRFAFRCPSKEGAGNAGCALHPRSRVQKAERKSHTSIQGSGGNPTFPAQWLYGLLRALPGVSGFLASVASRKLALWPGWAFAPPLRLDADH